MSSQPPRGGVASDRAGVPDTCASTAMTSCRRGPMVSRRSGCTFAPHLRHPYGTGLLVLTLTDDRICAITHFENSVLPSFGLPRSLAG
jgi:hypothetical protein